MALLGRKDNRARASAFEKLYAYYQQPIERYLLKRVHDQELAADLSQKTFTRVWEKFLHLDTILPGTSDHMRNWLFNIAERVAIDDYRRNKLIDFQPLSEDEAYTGFGALVVEFDFDNRPWLQEAFVQLPTKQRDSLAMQIRGHSEKEIAEKLGIKPSAVSMNISRAKAELRKKCYPVTIDFQRAEALRARDAIYGLISGLTGFINVGKIDEYEVKARHWGFRRGDMRENISKIRKDVLVDDFWVEPGTTMYNFLARGMYSRSGLWVPKGIITRDPEELMPFNLNDLG
jgi:RNA polymerase sigma factor (sigma-70 family)